MKESISSTKVSGRNQKRKSQSLSRKTISFLCMVCLIANLCMMKLPKVKAADSPPEGKYLSGINVDNLVVDTSTSYDTLYSTDFYQSIEANYNSYIDEANALKIGKPEELAAFAKFVNDSHDFSDRYVTLTNNIDLDGTKSEINFTESDTMFSIDIAGSCKKTWVPIGSSGTVCFAGTFDGKGYTVDNMIVLKEMTSYETCYSGLFGCVAGGRIVNVSVGDSSLLVGVSNCGGIAGAVFDGGVEGCFSAATVCVHNYDPYAGGITGYVSGASASVADCGHDGSVYVNAGGREDHAGGVVGSCATGSSIINCYNTGTVCAGSIGGRVVSGGVAGQNDGGSVLRCWNSGPVTAYHYYYDCSSWCGGVVGGSCGDLGISDCYNTGDVRVYSLLQAVAGGVIGACGNGRDIGSSSTAGTAHTVRRCYNSGAVLASGDSEVYRGACCGYPSTTGTITCCYYDTNTSDPDETGMKAINGTDDEDNSVEGLTTKAMQGDNAKANMTGFADAKDDAGGAVWYFLKDEYPLLTAFRSGIIIGKTEFTYGDLGGGSKEDWIAAFEITGGDVSDITLQYKSNEDGDLYKDLPTSGYLAAGTYTLKVQSGSYQTETVFTVYGVSSVDFDDGALTKVYDTKPISPDYTVTRIKGGGTVLADVTFEYFKLEDGSSIPAPKDVGSYTVVATLTDPNYGGEVKEELPFLILQARWTIIIIDEDGNGSDDREYKFGADAKSGATIVTCTDVNDPDTYTVDRPVSVDGKTYYIVVNGVDGKCFKDSNEGGEVSITYEEDKDNAESSTESPTAPGKYILKVTVKDCPNYEQCVEYVNFAISGSVVLSNTAVSVKIMGAESKVYDGEPVELPTYEIYDSSGTPLNNYAGMVAIEYSSDGGKSYISRTPYNAGSYKVRVSVSTLKIDPDGNIVPGTVNDTADFYISRCYVTVSIS